MKFKRCSFILHLILNHQYFSLIALPLRQKLFLIDYLFRQYLELPFFVDVLRSLAVGHDEFQFEHRLCGREDAQKDGVSAVLVLIVIRFALLAVAIARAVVLDENRDLFAGALRNVDVKIGEAASSVGRDGVERVVVGLYRTDEPVFEQLVDDHHAVHVIDPVVAGRTHVDDRPLGKRALHFIEDEKQY